MTYTQVGRALGGKSPDTGRRFMTDHCPIAVYLVGNKRYVARDEFERWLESRRIEPERTSPGSRAAMKQWLDQIADKVEGITER